MYAKKEKGKMHDRRWTVQMVFFKEEKPARNEKICIDSLIKENVSF